MSFWGFEADGNTLTTSWSSLNQFDDMVWGEFGQTNGDHVVPDPNNSTESSWLSNNGDGRKRVIRDTNVSGSTFNSSPSVAESLSEIISGTGQLSDEEDGSKEGFLLQDPALAVDRWSDLGIARMDLPSKSEPFGLNQPLITGEIVDASSGKGIEQHPRASLMREDAGLYICEEDTSMVTHPFSISDVVSQQGAMEIFGDEQVARKADTLLELGWDNIGNLDDMEKLFRDSDTSFEPVMVNGTDGLDWPSSSPLSVVAMDNGVQFGKSSVASERVAVKLEVNAVEAKNESVFHASLPELPICGFADGVAGSGNPGQLNLPATSIKQQSGPCTDKIDGALDTKSSDAVLREDISKEETGQCGGSVPETEKASLAQASRARRHAANRKRCEERNKRATSNRKLSPGPPYSVAHADGRQRQPVPLRLLGQTAHLQRASAYPIQNFPSSTPPGQVGASHQLQVPENLPYVQAGFPIQHTPSMSCPSTTMLQMQHPQPTFVDPGQQVSHAHIKPHVLPQPSPLACKEPLQQHQLSFNNSDRPPTSSPSMTPQEKLEKLRWRQQMQARMAVEQQQQQLLASQNVERLYHNHQQEMCQNLLSNPSGTPLTPAGPSDCFMKSSLETDQRLMATEEDVPLTNDREGEEDSSLEGSVLCHMKNTVAALDIDTRLCIRDALFRLARSAMQRRAAGGDTMSATQGSQDHDSDVNAMESSTASGPPSRHSRATSMSMVETETNPLDRSIAKLLFSRPPPQMFGRNYVYVPENPSLSGRPQLLVEPYGVIAPNSQ